MKKRKGPPPRVDLELFAACAANVPTKELAIMFGVSATTIRFYRRRLNIPPPAKYRPRRDPTVAVDSPFIIQTCLSCPLPCHLCTGKVSSCLRLGAAKKEEARQKKERGAARENRADSG